MHFLKRSFRAGGLSGRNTTDFLTQIGTSFVSLFSVLVLLGIRVRGDIEGAVCNRTFQSARQLVEGGIGIQGLL